MLWLVPKPSKSIQLAAPDSHYLLAATGWLELGNPVEAHEELDHISPTMRNHPDVLDLRWQIFAHEKKWEASLNVAATMTLQMPLNVLGWVHRSYALHELKRTEEARDNLLSVMTRFPKDFLMRYNLACYECQLERLEEAREWLKKAMEMAGKADIRAMALSDPDLQPMWAEIRDL